MADLDPHMTLNLRKAKVLVMESNQHAADMLCQILKGFGVGEVHRCTTIADCETILAGFMVDLIIADPRLRDGDAFDVLYELRHSEDKPARFAPIIVLSGHSTSNQVKRSRDIGANFFVAKPIAPAVLLERILWVARDKRPFVEVAKYIGPDRRFKSSGEGGRRETDMKDPAVSAAATEVTDASAELQGAAS